MPIHDWTCVSAGTFHDFHTAWLTHIKEALNHGLLPEVYYAQAEQRAGQVLPDVLTLHTGSTEDDWEPSESDGDHGESVAVAVADSPPRVSFTMRMSDAEVYHLKQKTLVIRHASEPRIVALLEIVSPANKDRPGHVQDFVEKARSALRHGYHLLILDLLPPGRHDPGGMHGVIWARIGGEDYTPPPESPLTLAAYVAEEMPVAYVEPTAVGATLIPMPLFLDPRWYVNVPLEETYEQAWQGVPRYWRRIIEGA